MPSEMLWKIKITNLEVRIGIGIHGHEQLPQRILVSVEVEGNYPARPASIRECFDYDHLYRLVMEQWPAKPHTLLLETLVVELMEYIFGVDNRVDRVVASIMKPDIFANAESVGVEAQWSRADYERHKQS